MSSQLGKVLAIVEPIVEGLELIAKIAAPAVEGPLREVSAIVHALESAAAGTIGIPEVERIIAKARADHDERLAKARAELDAKFDGGDA